MGPKYLINRPLEPLRASSQLVLKAPPVSSIVHNYSLRKATLPLDPRSGSRVGPYPKALRTHILRFLGPTTISYKACGLF